MPWIVLSDKGCFIPGGGTVVTFTFGVTADLGLTFRMQAELVLEMAAGGNVMADARARADTLEALQGLGVGLCLNRFGGAGTLLGSLR